ncbi:uncharacterized protein LOC121382627 [Gigantopelta aegis]|uniref:uncharacterized protein LOC121382627 n=1 Tax=Gigantopelta aegis TaxID=1735272 RepID=UPI001B88C630|nr:uncharacterized protein LOC121382627 [Gigantopelta aegis]
MYNNISSNNLRPRIIGLQYTRSFHMIRGLCLLILFNVSISMAIKMCKQTSQCSCALETGETIDLHRIPSKTVDTFKNVHGPDGFVYTYDPCSPFPCSALRRDSYLCRSDLMHRENRCLANVSGIVAFETDSSGVAIHYLTQDHLGNISSIVYLKCDPVHGDRFIVKETQSQLVKSLASYEFELHSACACVDGCLGTVSQLSFGSLMLLIFFSVVMMYFGVGCIYNKTVNGSTGSELIPQSGFWCSLPGLIKDGYFFFISPCLGDRIEYRYYDKL